MLNKKAMQFNESVDLAIGIILFIVGLIIFAFISEANELTLEEQNQIQVVAVEQGQQKIDLINLISDEYISDILADLQEGKIPTELVPDDRGFRVLCPYSMRLEISSRTGLTGEWAIIVTDETKYGGSIPQEPKVFQCGPLVDRYKGTTYVGEILIPTIDSEKTLTMELYKNE